MSNYYIGADGYWCSEEEYLQHWGSGKGHKYLLKIGEGIKARYLYTQAEVDAYRRSVAANKKLINEKQQNAKAAAKYAKKTEKEYQKATKANQRKIDALDRDAKRDSRILGRMFKSGYNPKPGVTKANKMQQLSWSPNDRKYTKIMKRASERNVERNALQKNFKDIDNAEGRRAAYAQHLLTNSNNALVKTKDIAKGKNREALKTMITNIFNGPPKVDQGNSNAGVKKKSESNVHKPNSNVVRMETVKQTKTTTPNASSPAGTTKTQTIKSNTSGQYHKSNSIVDDISRMAQSKAGGQSQKQIAGRDKNLNDTNGEKHAQTEKDRKRRRYDFAQIDRDTNKQNESSRRLNKPSERNKG